MIDRLFVLFGAFVFFQAPVFMQQYTHQLAGHTAELVYQVQRLEIIAEESNKPLAEYIQKFSSNQDADFARQGSAMSLLIDRSHHFTKTLAELQSASVYTKPYIFITSLNTDVFQATWRTFEFGMTFTWGGLAYALIGALFGYTIFSMLAHLFRSIGRFFSFRKAPTTL